MKSKRKYENKQGLFDWIWTPVIHRRLSHDTLHRYAALCIVGHLVRKISLSWISIEAVAFVSHGNHCEKLANEITFYI